MRSNDPIKDAFNKVKLDITNLKKQMLDLSNLILDLSKKFDTISTKMHLDASKQASKKLDAHLNASKNIDALTDDKDTHTHLNASKPYTSTHLDASKRIYTSKEWLDMEKLTYAEKDILKVLHDHEGMRLGYKDIAEILNKNFSTIRNQMCRLKRVTNLLVETQDTKGNKRYSLKNNIKLKQFIGVYDV